MTTDYLGEKFPPYVLTEDTTVVRFKRYFRKDGGGYSPVLDSLSTDNPKTKGWYEFKSNHSEEFHFNVGSVQVNNIADVCHTFMIKLQQFPKWTLPRTTSIAGITLDWKGHFNDAVWNETIGTCVVPPYGVNFSTNLYFAEHLNILLNQFAQLGSSKKTSTGWNTLKEMCQGFLDNISTSVGRTYSNFGYSFDPTTLGSEARTNDVFTLAGLWEDIDFREIMRMLQDGLRDMDGLTDVDVVKDAFTQLNELVPNAARTTMDLALRTNSLDVTSAEEFTVRMVEIPGTIDVDGVTYYRLNSKAQLKSGAKYGLLIYNNDGSVSVLEPDTVTSPSTYFIDLDLPEYRDSISTDSIDLPVRTVQNKKIWFTTVPFDGK